MKIVNNPQKIAANSRNSVSVGTANKLFAYENPIAQPTKIAVTIFNPIIQLRSFFVYMTVFTPFYN